MERFVINSVNDMFRWKLPKEDLVDGEGRIFQKSVEDYFRASIDALLWGPNTDVLYSFMLIYYLGISLYKEDAFNQLYQDEKNKQPKNKLCRYSTKFLYKCSKNERFESFNSNQDVVGFVNKYFSLGNVIPIWPGGNEAPGFYIKGYKNSFSNLEEFKKQVKNGTDFTAGTGFYFDYLKHRVNVIKKREEELYNFISKGVKSQ